MNSRTFASLFLLIVLSITAQQEARSQGTSTQFQSKNGSVGSRETVAAPPTLQVVNAELLKKKFLAENFSDADLKKFFEELKKVPSSTSNTVSKFDIYAANLLAARYKTTLSDDRFHADKQAAADYYYTKCEEFRIDPSNVERSNSYCKKAEEALKEFVDIRRAAPEDKTYTYKPQIVPVPTYDLKTSQVKVDEKTYDFKTGQVVTTAAPNNPGGTAPVVAAAAAAAGPAVVAAKGGGNGGNAKDVAVDAPAKPANEALNYTCSGWKDNLKRKILRGASCNTSGSRICSGYVVCEKNGKAFSRLATCSESLCGDTQAEECSKQPGFGSKDPGTEDTAFTDAKAPAKAAGAAK